MFAQYLSNAQVLEGQEGSAVASPVDADFSSLPPVTIHSSSDELLLADAVLMAKRLETAGIRCDLHLRDGRIDDFPLAADMLPEGGRPTRYVGDFVKNVTAAPNDLPDGRDLRCAAAARYRCETICTAIGFDNPVLVSCRKLRPSIDRKRSTLAPRSHRERPPADELAA